VNLSAVFFAAALTALPSVACAQAQPASSPSAAASPTAAPSVSPAPQPTRRAQPAPLDPIFPSADFLGPTIGVPNDDTAFPLQKALHVDPATNGNIRIYGWIDPGYEWNSSKNSTYPMTYNVVPNKLVLDQLILRLERQPDTVQTDHTDWGFRFSSLYGVDYRWTTAEGYFSDQLLSRNQEYGYDPVEAYGMLYLPHLGQGTVFQIGRYISPPDIEAQLAPNNYLYTHSLMFDFDAYTQTGVLASTKLTDMWTLQYGTHWGNDMAPWDPSAHPGSLELIARYVTKSNKDSLLFGIDSVNFGRDGGKFKAFTSDGLLYGHDNLQQFNATWTHVWNPTFHNLIEGYYLYEFDTYVGGTINNGPFMFGGGGGAGAFLPGRSTAIGIVDYLEKKIGADTFATFRTDYLNDPRGWRSGFATSMGSLTAGITVKPSSLVIIRPEIRYERAFAAGVTPWDNGTKRYQKSFGIDYIQDF